MLLDLATYNAFDEKAREVYFQQAKRGLYDQGFDAWWCDSTEPFSGPDWNGEEKGGPLRCHWKIYQPALYLDALHLFPCGPGALFG